jgi:hypothetical protein
MIEGSRAVSHAPRGTVIVHKVSKVSVEQGRRSVRLGLYKTRSGIVEDMGISRREFAFWGLPREVRYISLFKWHLAIMARQSIVKQYILFTA